MFGGDVDVDFDHSAVMRVRPVTLAAPCRFHLGAAGVCASYGAASTFRRGTPRGNNIARAVCLSRLICPRRLK